MAADTVALREEMLEGEPLLRTVMRSGKRTGEWESLETIRSRFKHQIEPEGDIAEARLCIVHQEADTVRKRQVDLRLDDLDRFLPTVQNESER